MAAHIAHFHLKGAGISRSIGQYPALKSLQQNILYLSANRYFRPESVGNRQPGSIQPGRDGIIAQNWLIFYKFAILVNCATLIKEAPELIGYIVLQTLLEINIFGL